MNNQFNNDMSGTFGNCASSKTFESSEGFVGTVAVSESTAVATLAEKTNISYVGESFETIDFAFLTELGVRVEKIHQSYAIVRILHICVKAKKWRSAYVELNNLMHQWTGKNTLEFIATYDLQDSLEGIEGFIAFILKSLRGYMKDRSDEAGYDWSDNSDVSSESDDERLHRLYGDVDEYEGQSLDDVLEKMNKTASGWMTFMSSEFGRKVSTLTSLLVCIPVLNRYGVKPNLLGYEGKIEEGLRYDYSKYSRMSLMAIMIEHTTWVARKVIHMFSVICQHGIIAGIRSLFVSQDDFQEFDIEYLWLKKNSKNFSCRNLVVGSDGKPDPFTLDTYRHRGVKALEMANRIEVSVKHDPFAWSRIRSQKYEIQNFMSLCDAQMRMNEKRPYPYAMMLCGPPEVGKSFLKDRCFEQMHITDSMPSLNDEGEVIRAARFDVPYSPSNIYTRNPNDDFYSGYETSHTGMMIDDVAQKTPELVKQLGGDDLADLITIINTIPFLPNQAELEKKGKTPMFIRYFMGTTNTPDLSVQHVFKCPEAVLRRMVFIDVEVKPEYRKPGSIALRGDLEDPYNADLWTFAIYRFFPTGQSMPLKVFWNGKEFHTTSTPKRFELHELMMFIKVDLNAHWEREEKTEKIAKHILDSSVCEHGIKSVLCKQCKSKNVGESDETPRMVWFNPLDPVAEEPVQIGPIRRFIRRCEVYALCVPISLLLTMGFFGTILFRVKDGPPILPLRLARNLIRRVPMDMELPYVFRIVGFLPNMLLTKSMHYGEKYLRLYFDKEYYRMTQPKFMWGTYWKTELVAEWLFKFATVFIGTFMVFKTLPLFTKNVGHAGDMRMPVPDANEKRRKNCWKKNEKIGRFPSNGASISEKSLCDHITINSVYIQFRTFDGVNWNILGTNGFVLQNNIVVTVLHSVAGGNWPDSIVVTFLDNSGRYVDIDTKIDESCCYKDTANDLVYIRVDRMNMKRNMTGYFSNEGDIHINCPGKIIYFHPGERCHKEIAVLRANYQSDLFYEHKGVKIDASECLVAQTNEPTFKGLCGAPLLLTQGTQKMIFGIHCAGPADKSIFRSICRPISRDMITEACRELRVIPIDDNDQPIAYITESKAMQVVDVHPKCPTHKLRDGELIVIGGTALPRVAPRTQVKRSPISNEVLQFYKRYGFKKIMHTSPIDCSETEAIMLSMSKAVDNAQFYPSEIDFVVDSLSKEYLSHFTEEMLERLHPYPMSVAINGVDGIPYLERLNLSTSGGYGHPGSKKKLFREGQPTESHTVNYVLTPELESEVNWILEQYENGREANPVFKCSFKDEPITLEKAAMSKVRIFSGSPVAFSLVVRMYFMCLIREFVGSRRINFEMAIGANAHGLDWDEIYHHVVRHGEKRVFAGDYKNFDKQMSPEIIMAAFRVFINIFKAAGWSQQQLQIVYGIAVDTAHPTMDLFGTLIKCFGSNPSGHVLTTIVNSVVNSLYIRLACRRILLLHNIEADFSKFRDIVSLITYGDDNCGSVNEKYPMITHATIQEALGEAGIIYTTDDKKSLSVGLTDVSSITFLKRRFVYSEELQRMVAPLVEESLYKSLTVWTFSKVISVEEQLSAVLDSVNREYFFYGRKAFEERRKFFLEVADRHGIIPYLPNGLPTYDELLEELKYKV